MGGQLVQKNSAAVATPEPRTPQTEATAARFRALLLPRASATSSRVTLVFFAATELIPILSCDEIHNVAG